MTSEAVDDTLEAEIYPGAPSKGEDVSDAGYLHDVALRQLLDNIPIICFTSAPDGQVTWLNKAWHEFTGLGPGES